MDDHAQRKSIPINIPPAMTKSGSSVTDVVEAVPLLPDPEPEPLDPVGRVVEYAQLGVLLGYEYVAAFPG